MTAGVCIYVMPTEEGLPPRAIIYAGPIVIEDDAKMVMVTAQTGTAMWSRDEGAWMMNGVQVVEDIADAITEHAKNLGVEW